MLGQWRKCKFCKRRFRLTGRRRVIFCRFDYVTFQNKFSGEYEYAHRKCYNRFLKTTPKKTIYKLIAGLNIKRGLFIEGSFEDEE